MTVTTKTAASVVDNLNVTRYTIESCTADQLAMDVLALADLVLRLVGTIEYMQKVVPLMRQGGGRG